MKEATGEANMTIVTVVLIAVVSAIAAILVPNIMATVKRRSCCTAAGGVLVGKDCKESKTSSNIISIDECISGKKDDIIKEA